MQFVIISNCPFDNELKNNENELSIFLVIPLKKTR